MSHPGLPDAAAWDARYAAGSPWGREPNRTVREIVAPLVAGRARDVAAGDGRHALWLAASGWDVDALDFSSTAMEHGRSTADALAGELSGTISWQVADATLARPEPLAYDLVLHAYLHLPPDAAGTALALSASGVAPGGLFLLVGHDRSNLEHGTGGPQDPTVLTDLDDVRSAMEAAGLVIERAEVIRRTVPTAERPALDTLVLARRPSA
jgi:SAM-dependent methyltransferase